MTAIGQSLGGYVCKALPGIHALTGCDSTSAFVGKGKRQAFHFPVESGPNMRAAMMMVGNSFGHDDERMCSVCMLTVRKQWRRHGQSSVQTVLQKECTVHMVMAGM